MGTKRCGSLGTITAGNRGKSHFDRFSVVYEVPTPLSDLFERYFNIIDGRTD